RHGRRAATRRAAAGVPGRLAGARLGRHRPPGGLPPWRLQGARRGPERRCRAHDPRLHHRLRETTMTTTIIAVLGTLAGALLSGVLGHLSQRAQLKAQADHTRRTESLAAVTDLVAALADHRRAMW